MFSLGRKGPNLMTSDLLVEERSSWVVTILCWAPGALHPGDLLCLAHCPCSAPACLTAYPTTSREALEASMYKTVQFPRGPYPPKPVGVFEILNRMLQLETRAT